MKKMLLPFLAIVAVFFCFADDGENRTSPDGLKVLMIGNSFSISCTRQLPLVAEAN